MSLFLSQQKIPFQSVNRYLRAFAPSCSSSPEEWAAEHAANVTAGDVVVVFDTILSPWGDSSAGIGVADGDSFKAAQLVLVCESGGQAASIVVSPEGYRKQSIEGLLANEARAAKDNGTGFYYAVLRPNKGTPDREALAGVTRELSEYGGRAENGSTDVPFTFLHAAGVISEQPAVVLDITSFGYALFVDKEPPAGSRQPDLRSVLSPVSADEKVSTAAASTAAATASSTAGAGLHSSSFMGAPPPLPADAPAVGAALPKMPSFFSQPKISTPAQAFQPGGGMAPSAPAVVPAGAPASSPAAQAAPPPAPTIRRPEPPRRIASPGGGSMMPGGMSGSVPAPPAMKSTPAVEDEGTLIEEININNPNVSGERGAVGGGVLDWSLPSDQSSGSAATEPLAASADTADSGMSIYETLSAAVAAAVGDALPSPSSQPPSHVKQPPSLTVPFVGTTARAESAKAEPQTVPANEEDDQAPVADEEKSGKVGSVQQAYIPDSDARSLAERARQQTEESTERTDRSPAGLSDEQAGESAAAASAVSPYTGRRKRADGIEPARTPEAVRAQLKETPAVKSGVAGVIPKLEHQAGKASSKLESQVDEIQNRLNDELKRLLSKVEGAEKRSVKSAEGLRINLTHRLENATNDVKEKVNKASQEGADTVRQRVESGSAAMDGKQEELRSSLGESFDEVRARAESVAKTYEDSITGKATESLAELDEMRQSIQTQLHDLEDSYKKSLQSCFEHVREQLQTADSSIVDSIEKRHHFLDGELADLHNRCLVQLDQTKGHLLQRLYREITVAQAEISKLQAVGLEEQVLPRMKQHREELRVITGEFQHKLGQDLERKGQTKVKEFGPLVEDKKRKLVEMREETNSVKDTIEEQLRTNLEGIFTQLKQFVTNSIEQAQTAHRRTEEQLAEIDRAVRVLADPSSIESDMELLNERNDVLETIEEVTEDAKEEVLGTLRRLVASLEERGKHLQEELITSMEEDAYRVRKASEQALATLREAVNESFVAIQTAQDERMPM